MIRVKLSGRFDQEYRDLVEDDKELKEIVAGKIKLFKKNPEDTRLRNHPLKRRLEGKWAFSITEDVRILYKWRGKNSVRFLAVGGHPQVYGKRVKN